MSNMLMIHHAATRGNERRNEQDMGNERGIRGDYGRRNTYDQPGMSYDGNEDRAGMRQHNQYPMRDDYGGGAESRYRGKDGRWKAGTRRSEYEGGTMDYEPEPYRMGGDDEEERRKYQVEVLPSNVVRMPERMPSTDYRTSRQIGFGAMNAMGGEYEHQEHAMGRSEGKPMEFDRETAEHWVRSMRNEDKAHPVGGKWSPDMLKPLAQKYGIPTEGKKFWEFYAMTNAMYSDYGEVARKFGITSPEFYVCMAKAWMDDKDANPDKTRLYYEYIVEKE